ncbi:MAG TPA: type II CAAX endopeptidase family protein [Acidobacteriaceae bacterium]|nr:type II CAAX endopeptidase family protein [Acidobacteriaceae bacterium]
MDSNAPLEIATPPATPPAPVDDGTAPFIGRFGLRAGWGIAIYILLFAVFALCVNIATLAHQGKLKSAFSRHSQTASAPAVPAKHPPRDLEPGITTLEEGSILIAVALISWILSRIERRPVRVYGIGRNRLGDFLPGAFWGLACLSLLVGVLRATHVLVFDARVLTGSAIFIYGARWLLLFLTVGLLEEYLTRGYLQYTLTRGLIGLGERISPAHGRAVAFWTATVIMSLLFGAGHLHNSGETAVGILSVFLAGAIFSYALWHTGSLWWAIGFHMAWDWAQSFLYGVPDSGGLSAHRLFNTHPTGKPLLSGGATGPEGSIFVLPIMVLIALIIRFTTRPGVQPELEPLPKTHSIPPEPNAVIA